MAEPNEEMFDAMIRIAGREVMRREAEAFPAEDDIDLNFSPSFERKMKRLIRQSRRRPRQKPGRVLQAALASVLVILLAVSSAFAFSPQFRERAVKALVEWTGISAGFTFTDDNDKISDGIRPAYIPDGFVEVDYWEGSAVIEIKYINEVFQEIIYWRNLAKKGSKISIDSEHSDYRTDSINGLEAHIFTSNTEGYPSYVLFYDDVYAYLISGEIRIEELIRMAESISTKK